MEPAKDIKSIKVETEQYGLTLKRTHHTPFGDLVTVQASEPSVTDHRNVCPCCKCWKRKYQSKAERQKAYRKRRAK
jgi:hypothetical protein